MSAWPCGYARTGIRTAWFTSQIPMEILCPILTMNEVGELAAKVMEDK